MHCHLFTLQRHEWFPGWAVMNKAVKSFSVNACFSEDDYFSGYILRSAIVMLEYGLLSFVDSYETTVPSTFPPMT